MKKFIIIILSVILAAGMATTASAADAIVMPEEFKSIGGHGNINQADQYWLDLADPGIIDMTGALSSNGWANSFFDGQIYLVRTTCAIYYYVSSFDPVEMIKPYVQIYQRNFKEKLFDGAIVLFIGLSLLGMAGVAIKRNYPEVFSRLTQIVALCVLSALLSTYSYEVISTLNSVSDAVGGAIVSSMDTYAGGDGEYETNMNYSLKTVKTLWRSLIHTPWMTLEFDKYTPDSSLVQDLLDGDLPRGSRKRQTRINEIHKPLAEQREHDGSVYVPFDKDMGASRHVYIFFLYLTLVPKCALYIIIAAAQCVFKIGTICLVMMGIIIMLLSVVPWFGGMKLLKKWGLQILTLQLFICLSSFLCGFIVLLDNLLYNAALRWGWWLASIFQILILIGIWCFRKQIFGFVIKFPTKLTTENSMDLTKIHARDVVGSVAGTVSSAASSVSQGVYNKTLDVTTGIYGAGANAYFKMADMGANVQDKISGYFGSSSGNTDGNSESQANSGQAARPSLNEITAASGAVVGAKNSDNIPRPSLPETESDSRASSKAGISASNLSGVTPVIAGIDEASARATTSANERPSILDNSETTVKRDEPRATDARLQENAGFVDETIQPQEKGPLKPEKSKIANYMENQNNAQNDRLAAAEEFRFDLGQFEPRETTVDNGAGVKRPIIKDVS